MSAAVPVQDVTAEAFRSPTLQGVGYDLTFAEPATGRVRSDSVLSEWVLADATALVADVVASIGDRTVARARLLGELVQHYNSAEGLHVVGSLSVERGVPIDCLWLAGPHDAPRARHRMIAIGVTGSDVIPYLQIIADVADDDQGAVEARLRAALGCWTVTVA